MPWPTVAVVTTGMDADTDALPRADILDHTNKFNQLIAMRGVADGVCDLDASTLVPAARLPGQLPSLSALTAQQATDVRSLTTYIGTLLNDADAETARATLGAESTLLSTITTTALTSAVDFTGLDIAAHKGYRIEIEYANGTATGHDISMYINALTADTDYYMQLLYADGVTVTATRLNNARIASVNATDRCLAVIDLNLANGGYALASSLVARGTGTTLLNLTYAWARTAAVANITGLTFAANVANGIGIGTTFRIYRKDK